MRVIGSYDPAAPSDTADTADAVVVVGAGPAGIATALALRARGVPVVLLDAGEGLAPAEPHDADELPGGGLPYRLEAARRRGFGGTGEAWHGQCARLHADDLEPRAAVGGLGWPFGSEELDRWYPGAEEFFGVTADPAVDRWSGHPLLRPPAWDPTLLRHDFTEYAPRPAVGREHRRACAADPGLRVLLGAVVAGVELDGDGVVGVRLAGGRALPCRRVVLAAGAIENARLLMLSDPHGVGIGTGRVHTGRFLQDHPVIRTAEVLPRSAEVQDLYTGLHRRRVHLFPKVRLAPELQRAEDLLDATAVFSHQLRPSGLDAIARLRSGRPRGADVAAAARGLPGVARAVHRRAVKGLSSGLPADHVWLDLWLEQVPRAESRVRLVEDTDDEGVRRAVADWVVGDAEMRTSRRFTEVLAVELPRLGLADLRPLPAMVDDDAWRTAVSDSFHPAGTTRMAAAPGDGVVDPDLAVHGVEGLWVVGGSVFPTSGYLNPTLTIVALGLRLAEHLTRVGVGGRVR